ncbi:putative CAMK family protein kinase [Tritrichomonas foetus]|uniref:CAMK family protein kinase n=1 Tax=Tritrichomonas foetus TaxID=1144522 RepID=A0A1J4JJH0_9EUKA|nr:putative CAMK family protein kinase [Tritrichomonas foetus]|eukprot:OHS99306.1 putative CAMK family protein kinase [Tritrichomonas foetus]
MIEANTQGFLPFDDDSIRKTIKRIRKAKYRMPNSIDPVIQDLIKKILTADPSKRITIKQIKQHPAIRIGLPYTYYLPAPFPIPTLTNPIVISSQNDSTLDSLQQIGFVDRSNLLTLLQSDTPNMAKVFYLMLTQPFDLETLPWGKPMMSRSYPNLIFEHPFVFPVDYDSNYTDPFDLSSSQQSSPYNSPLNASVYNMDQSDWVPNPPQIIYEQEQNIRNISLSMPLLMLTLQKFFTEKEYDWFHPNDRTIVTKQISMSLPFYITLLGIYDEKDITKITLCVKMTKGTADDFYMFFEMTRSLLSSYIEIVSDIELNDFNTLGNQPNVEMDVEDYAPDQNCNPM